MDQKNIQEAKKIIEKSILPSTNKIIGLLKNNADNVLIEKHRKYLDQRILLLKEYLDPENQNNRHPTDKGIFSMADTLNGLLKAFSINSLESLKEVCNGIKKEI